MPFLTLPTEVVELVLISAAAAGHPETIAAFSQTCRAYRDLVYGPSDHHLWREIFLTEFDDPRVLGGGPGWSEAEAHKASCCRSPTFNWGEEYRSRIWAARYIRWQTRPPASTEDDEEPEHLYFSELEIVRRNTRALDALISVVFTALPCPATIVFSFIPPDDTSHASDSPSAGYPTFPPLPQAMTGPSSDIIPMGPFDGSGRGFGQALSARNMAWLQTVLERGYPPSVTARFCGDKWEGGIAGQYLEEYDFNELQSAGRLIACTGFKTVPQDIQHRIPRNGIAEERVTLIDHSEEQQLRRARRLARMRVYNMRYLARERHWGPFLPCQEKKTYGPELRVDDDELLQPILALFRFPGAHDEGGNGEHEHEHLTDKEDEDEGNEDEGEEDTDEEAEEGASRGPVLPAAPPTALQLRPDWAYLAAARMVVEANLREAFSAEDLTGLVSLDGLRPGSAPWDAALYKPPEPESDKGKEKATDPDRVEGWDWAGVTGIWKRCVCWMDYRDLILHNLSGEFEDPNLAEAVRVIAMQLRIASYSPSEVPGYEHLPTIHVVGQTTGASLVGHRRNIHGTVGVVADGSVRWTLQFSSVEGGQGDEWVSEGIQIGGVASAMGVLGMWTGAQHERMDPLGPCWAWKVG
ncbi:hypothetical protein C8Q73DRAFT_690466 [Cubamyces lactineus]|nr:hypothetical protein C8Q73DRAFT_690466 [Cubamyces lactineus]